MVKKIKQLKNTDFSKRIALTTGGGGQVAASILVSGSICINCGWAGLEKDTFVVVTWSFAAKEKYLFLISSTLYKWREIGQQVKMH